ncbi:crotonobetainyl-CoA hydratase [Pseudonocardia hierapolitana]|uniref:Crotonobetainyl-CoA hydratase n=1 Tax=Pseudonocardia hierapolitana TaxID=1128676 RepID=A0A561SJB2_9PSEU|nr:enoyl-CoA hydratase-related protein [Pseudonocardia hierapolitana]TWF74970.1 crotonobetainyl-CoA hydratase [Pseudonocardia hierapolitana]
MNVRFEVDGHVGRITIDRPDVLNAVDRRTQRELEDAWDRVERDERIRVAVLTGTGDRAFCVGADMKSGDPDGLAYWSDTRRGGFGGISVRQSLLTPVIARVNGLALGGGFEMVLGADLAVAAESAVFGLPEALVGRLPLDGGVPLLLGAVPRKVAADVMFTGRRLSAAEALDLGLVNEAVPAGELDAAVDRWVERVLRAAPLSHRAIKQLLLASTRPSPEEITQNATPAVVRALGSVDGAEGPAAFREKRPPRWTGT